MQRGIPAPRSARRLCGAAAGLALMTAMSACAATDDAPAQHTASASATPTSSRTDPAGSGGPDRPSDPIQQAIAHRLSTHDSADDDMALQTVRAFYGAHDDHPAWYGDDGQPQPAARSLLDAIRHIDRQGLSPARYLGPPLASGVSAPDDADQRAAIDIALSRRFVQLAHDLHHGVVDDPSIHVTWRQPDTPVDYNQALAEAAAGDPASTLDQLAPQQPQYQALIQALARYRRIADTGGWPTIGEGPVLKQGMTDPRITTLWSRLQATGDAPSDQPAPSDYSHELMSAMRHYQARNGLKQDGLLGPSTRSALNVPVAQRIADIRNNMERWRWMPASFGKRYIAVNVPAFTLDAVDADGSDLSMDVIVGGSYHDKATPIFGDTMQYLVFRPFWNVPPSIAADEIVPKQRRNPDYLASKNYQIVRTFAPNAKPLAVTPAHIDAVADGDLLIRQAGGPANALGLVKFIFPNDHAVYLHSTPATQLFDRNDRDLSHGCVRVADPVALARFALEGKPDWTRQRIDSAMHTGKRKRVDLAQSIPVYMLYWTAFVEGDTMNFRADLYDHDQPLNAALKTASGQRT